MDAYAQGDTWPPFTAVLLNGQSRYDATNAASVTLEAWRDGTQIVEEAATTIGTDGVCTFPGATPTVTAEPGPVLSRVVVVGLGGTQTFPPQGWMKTLVSPASP